MKTLQHVVASVVCSLVLFGCVSTSSSKQDLSDVVPALKKHIDSTLAAKAAAGRFYSKYRAPDDNTIKKIAARPLTAEELAKLRQTAESLTREAEENIVWPRWIIAIWGETLPAAEKSLKAGRYDMAREIVWRASTKGVDKVDSAVRKLGYEFLNTRVNPAQWKIIERQMRDKAIDCAKREAYDEGIEYLKKYPHIREYSDRLDGYLDNVKKETVKLSISEDSVKPILAAARDAMKKAENIRDYNDSVTNSVGEVVSNLELSAYEKSIEDYRNALLRYNCTKANAQKISAALKKDIEELLAPLYGKETTSRMFLYLGTGAVNKRIDNHAKRLSDWLKTKKTFTASVEKLLAEGKEDEARKLVQEDVDAVAITPDVKTEKTSAVKTNVPSAVDLAFEGTKFRYKVNQLVAASKFAEARELIWSSCYPEKQTVVSLYLQPIGKELMLTVVNPANWAEIDASVSKAVAGSIEKGEFTNAVAMLKAYPHIKTYAGVIDAKLGNAAAEAHALGVDAKVVGQITGTAAASAAESANLADHTDKVDAFELAGRHLNVDAFNNLVEEYRKTLVQNNCTPENAKRLAEDFKAALEPKFAELRQPRSSKRLHLGCNALNDRIDKLVEEKIALVEKKIDEIESARKDFERFVDDFTKKVVALVKAGKYGEARDAIRDAESTGNAVLDGNRYAIRIALLNVVVNPLQCRALEKEIDSKVKELKDAADYDGLREYVKNYGYVHDTYPEIADSLGQVKEAVEALDIDKTSAEACVNASCPKSLRMRIAELLEGRNADSSCVPFDVSALEKVLAGLQDNVMKHYDRKDGVNAICAKFKKDILDLRAKELPPMTTCGVNARLKARLVASLQGIEKLEYAKRLVEMDNEVSFDAQIAMAEDAISRQIGVICPCAALEMNAVMGDYARIARMLQRGAVVSHQDATTLLVGAVYLNQPAMFKRALELGAKVDEASQRDPRKRPAVLVAIETGHSQFLSSINEAKGNMKVVDAKGNTALHYAMRSGNLAVAKSIFAMIDPMAVNAKGETALFAAVRRNQAGAVKFLLGLVKGADAAETAMLRKKLVGVKNSAGDDAFAVACKANASSVLEVLAAAGSEYGVANLVEAASADRVAIAQWLVGHGVDVNGKGVMAAAFGKPDDDDTATYKYLVSQGGIALKRTPKCCKELRAKLAEAEKNRAAKDGGKAKVSGTFSFETDNVK